MLLENLISGYESHMVLLIIVSLLTISMLLVPHLVADDRSVIEVNYFFSFCCCKPSRSSKRTDCRCPTVSASATANFSTPATNSQSSIICQPPTWRPGPLAARWIYISQVLENHSNCIPQNATVGLYAVTISWSTGSMVYCQIWSSVFIWLLIKMNRLKFTRALMEHAVCKVTCI